MTHNTIKIIIMFSLSIAGYNEGYAGHMWASFSSAEQGNAQNSSSFI